MSKIKHSKKKNGITIWSMTESYMNRSFEKRITKRVRTEGKKLLRHTTPDEFNDKAIDHFAEEEFEKIMAELDDKRAEHVLTARNIAAKHKSGLAVVDKQISSLEEVLKKIEDELISLDDSKEGEKNEHFSGM